METHMTLIEKRAFLNAALKEKTKWPRCYLVITDNHKFFKKNTEHNYLIKKHKLNINKKKTYILRTSSIRLLPGNKTSLPVSDTFNLIDPFDIQNAWIT